MFVCWVTWDAAQGEVVDVFDFRYVQETKSASHCTSCAAWFKHPPVHLVLSVWCDACWHAMSETEKRKAVKAESAKESAAFKISEAQAVENAKTAALQDMVKNQGRVVLS